MVDFFSVLKFISEDFLEIKFWLGWEGGGGFWVIVLAGCSEGGLVFEVGLGGVCIVLFCVFLFFGI